MKFYWDTGVLVEVKGLKEVLNKIIFTRKNVVHQCYHIQLIISETERFSKSQMCKHQFDFYIKTKNLLIHTRKKKLRNQILLFI